MDMVTFDHRGTRIPRNTFSELRFTSTHSKPTQTSLTAQTMNLSFVSLSSLPCRRTCLLMDMVMFISPLVVNGALAIMLDSKLSSG
jgi:hypothetical protein